MGFTDCVTQRDVTLVGSVSGVEIWAGGCRLQDATTVSTVEPMVNSWVGQHPAPLGIVHRMFIRS